MIRALRFAACALLALAAACQTTPYTHRKQFNFQSDSSVNELGLQSYQEAQKGAKIIKSGPQAEMVQRVAMKIAAAAESPELGDPKPNFDWQVMLVDSPEVNAWCLPGGKMCVYTGILPVAKDETGLAVVLGHEVSHAIAHHGAERMSQESFAKVGLGLADLAAQYANLGAESKATVNGLLGGATQLGVLLPFSRSHESEADHIGLILMSKAGYDPLQAPIFWQRMQALGGSSTPEFMSTHPSHETRVKDLQGWLPEAQKYYHPGGAAAPAQAQPKGAPVPKPKQPGTK